MPKSRAAVSVVVLRDDAVLLVRRGRAPAAGLWAPVGGRVEAGETAEAAASREVREETGVEVRLVGRCGRRRVESVTPEGEAFVYDIAVFAARWISGEPVAGDDAEAAAFVAFDRLAATALVPGGLEAIAAARDLLDGSPDPDALRKP